MQFKTKRLILREMTMDDLPALHAIFSDSETMRFYPGVFDEACSRAWIVRNQQRYAVDGFGLWTVVLRETGEVIGDCGVTMQPIHGVMLPEIGYHIRKDLWRRGYASEAARRCMEFLFETTDHPAVYSHMKSTNAPSYGVAHRNGMRFIEEYDDPVNIRTRVYAITREEWQHQQAAIDVARPEDIDAWMNLVRAVRDEFPGLEMQTALDEHRQTVLRFMAKGCALCARRAEKMTGVLLYSRKHSMICCLAVDPRERRGGVASRLLSRALSELADGQEITVTTFREGDPRGDAPRALYQKFGFVPEALLTEFDYPVQRFVLRK